MRYWVWSLFVAGLTFALMVLFKPPLWLFLLVAVPVLTVGLTMASFYYSFRPGLQPQPVPAVRYAARIATLDQKGLDLEYLGFSRIDSFYLKTIPDSVNYAYKHGAQGAFACIYHLGAKTNIDIVSRLSGDRSLTTNNSADSGNTPRPAGKMLQVFPGAGPDRMWAEHQAALGFLEARGIKAEDVPSSGFRDYFFKSMDEFKADILKRPFWPVQLVYWVVARSGRKYCRRIADQYRDGLDLQARRSNG